MNGTELHVVGANPGLRPALEVWGWQIAFYLFLGGLAAGLMVASGVAFRRGGRLPRSLGWWAPLLAPAVLAAGMLALFFDLEHKLHVWRFYATFRFSSPMSWGAWILLLVFPAMLAMAAVAVLERLGGVSGAWRRRIAEANLGLGIALGVYTGILLGALGARPLWNSSALGPLFLASGISSALALLLLLEPDAGARHTLAAVEKKVIGAEAAFLALLLIALATGPAAHRAAAGLLLGGEFTGVFWAGVVFAGMLVPVALEALSRAARAQPSFWPSVLVLLGAFTLRAVILFAGQVSRWEVL
jgi:formate-dependent nitrite reductase membrane component NrfD